MSIDTADQGSAQILSYPGQMASAASVVTRDRAQTVFGQVMGLVGLTIVCLQLFSSQRG